MLFFVCFLTVLNVEFNLVIGKCFVACGEDISTSVEEYSEEGPNRFYFYDVSKTITSNASFDALTNTEALVRDRHFCGRGVC